MNTTIALAILAPIALVIVPFMLIPRFRMERRARALLARYLGAERTSLYLAFHSAFADGKRREIDAAIAEMAQAGWTYLRATEASPLRTIKSLGGGLNLQFLRSNSNEARMPNVGPRMDASVNGVDSRFLPTNLKDHSEPVSPESASHFSITPLTRTAPTQPPL